MRLGQLSLIWSPLRPQGVTVSIPCSSRSSGAQLGTQSIIRLKNSSMGVVLIRILRLPTFSLPIRVVYGVAWPLNSIRNLDSYMVSH